MTQIKKRLGKWRDSPPREAPLAQVEAILDRYFKGRYERKKGSHIVVRDDRLRGLEGFGLLGEFTIAVKGGRHVKQPYLRVLAEAVSILEELKREEDEDA